MSTFTDPGQIGMPEFLWGEDLDALPGDQLALVDEATGQRCSYAELGAAIRQLAETLLDIEGDGDGPVILLLPSGIDFIVAYHGILAAGRTVLPLDPLATADDWTSALSACRPTLAITSDALWRRLQGMPAVGSVLRVAGTGKPTRHALPIVRGEATAALLSSSGTTGVPKLVTLTHRNLAVNLAQATAVHQLTASDVVLAITPLHHIYGMQAALNPTLKARATLVIAARPVSPSAVLRTIARHQVTVAYLVPTVLAELAWFDHTDRYDTTSLRLVFTGGAPLAEATAVACGQRLGAPVVQGYGMTEAGGICMPPDDAPGPLTSVGIPVPATEIRLLDPDTGRPVASGAAGELCVRGPQISPGYRNDPHPTTTLLDQDGWLHTGDLASVDERGYVTITGRIKQLIKYKGHQVSPTELEAILLTHPQVADAAVTGVPDPVAGELPTAHVVLRRPVALSEVIDFVRARVAPHKRIRRIESVSQIPRTATGKIRRDALGQPSSLPSSQLPAESGLSSK